jgi:hypothetical protein
VIPTAVIKAVEAELGLALKKTSECSGIQGPEEL